MVLAKPWYYTAIICAKKKVLNSIKICKKVEIVSIQLQVTNTI